ETGTIIDNFVIKGSPIKAVAYHLQSGILALIKNEPLIQVSPSLYSTRIARLNPIDGSVEKFIEISGFEENEELIDLCSDNNSIFFLTKIGNKKKIKQFLIGANQLQLLT